MVLVNGQEYKEFKLYQLDTAASLMTRLAALFDTLPDYLSFEADSPLSNITENSNIVVKDILALIRKNAKKNTDFLSFIPSIPEDKQKMITDILKTWLAYNIAIEELQQLNSAILTTIGQTLVENGYFKDLDEFETFWKHDRTTLKKNMDADIKFQKQDNERNVELFEIFDSIEDGLVYTDFKIERMTLSAVLDLSDISILEIFNNIVLNESVPFATCKNYFKILKDYVPSDEWSKTVEHILLKVNEKLIVDTTKYRDYTNVEIFEATAESTQEGSTSSQTKKYSTEMRLNMERGYLSKEQFIQRFSGVFPKLPIKFTSVSETEVVGIFYFPQERINTYVFSDLVMNNKLFSNLINIDESTKATKKKSDANQPWLYIHFNHNLTGHVTAAITQKTVDRSDPEMREEDIDIFPHGEPYIRVRAKGKDIQSLDKFQNILSKLLVIYGQNYNEIVEIYEQFIPGFGIIEQQQIPLKKKQSELMAPDIFIKNYSRNCNEARMPTIVSKEDAMAHKNEGKQIMKFPRKIPENGPVYPSDGKNQQYYICLNPEYPYPGIQINKLSNSDKYPYVPCCFKTDQQNRKGGLYRLYFHGEEIEAKEKKQQELIITDKFLSSEKYGVLPNDLVQLFEIMDPDPTYKYIRVGVFRSPSSFLEAVMVSLYEQTGILELEDEEARAERLLEIRTELSAKNIAPLSKQSAYDISIKQLQTNIADMDYYLDPKLFTQLLEGYFNCNIYLFNREKMILPRYLQSYYENKKDGICVFIYEHWGSESDHAKYPQCELIIRWNTTKGDDTQYSFPNGQKISRNMRKVSQLLSESYALDKQIEPIIFPYEAVNIKSQAIDSYGKCRQLNIEYEGKKLTLLTSPLPPLAVVIENDYNRIDIDTAVNFIHSVGSEIQSQTTSGKTVDQINCIIGNVNVSIPIQSGAILEDIPVNNENIVLPNSAGASNTSDISMFNHNKKIARYVVEYCFWLFSRYLQDKKIETVNDKVLAKFAKNKIKVVEGFQYPNIPKLFSTESKLLQDGKLVVESLDMMKRLLYVLKLYTIRDMKSLSSYYLRNTITNYYVDITDFDQLPTQVILQGEDAIDKWIQENKLVYLLHDEISVGQQSPYFFKNSKVGEEIFLAQNANDLQSALSISIEWQKRGYNEGIYYTNEKYQPGLYSFILYVYTSNTNIVEKHVVGRKELKAPIRILGYKLSGKPSYTCLLSLN